MSFLNKVMTLGRRQADDQTDEMPFDDGFPASQQVVARRGGGAALAMEMPAGRTSAAMDSSIITEAAPSEMPSDAMDTRVGTAPIAQASSGAKLPLIGHLSAGRQQLILWSMLSAAVVILL